MADQVDASEPRGADLIAVVTLDPGKVLTGGATVFVAATPDEREKVARYLGRILDAQVHDLENGVYVVVRH